ncbi:hypothetical protein B0H19DRAFT_1085536 [Mycena capillaripes]|nr:hypothetical protein B0H19DRAFT_1085536 [Mycena capillaripes]
MNLNAIVNPDPADPRNPAIWPEFRARVAADLFYKASLIGAPPQMSIMPAQPEVQNQGFFPEQASPAEHLDSVWDAAQHRMVARSGLPGPNPELSEVAEVLRERRVPHRWCKYPSCWAFLPSLTICTPLVSSAHICRLKFGSGTTARERLRESDSDEE